MKTIAMLAALLLAAACSLGGGSKETFYVLSGPEAPAPASHPGQLVIAVGPVAVPESVDRAPMVLMNSANQVDLSEEHRWAEPLKTAIPRIVGEHLMRLLNTPRVMTSRLGSSAADIDYRVALEVQRFDSSLTQGATLDVLWTITGKRANPARSGRSSVREPATAATPEGVAAAHSRALARVASDIAAAVR
jgi:uncharacterized lipoprotein YmbA